MNILASVFCGVVLLLNHECQCGPSFNIESHGKEFIKDGNPFRYVSGSLQYFHVPSALWRDRMIKYKMAGLNAIETYVEWSSHEPEEGIFDFEGDRDLVEFLQVAKSLNLYVILRTGPYIDSERDMGGFPYWLFSKNKNMKVRTSDPSFLNKMDKWFSLLLPMIQPMLYKNGGPVLMVQIEDEYGSYYACDYQYYTHLRNLHEKYLGNDVLLFTLDENGDHFFRCGKLENVFATIGFGVGAGDYAGNGNGPDPVRSFNIQQVHQQYGPRVNSEYYIGWFDHWEEPHHTTPSSDVCETLDVILSLNASVNLFPMHGGTNFGFGSGGSIINNTYKPIVTSYDFDAPLTEAGDPTQKYFDIRKIIGKYLPLPNGPLPSISPKMQLDPLKMKSVVNIYDIISKQTPIKSLLPMTFEQLRLSHGFILYSTKISFPASDPAVLTINGLHDRAQVFVDRKYWGTLSRTQNLYQIGLDIKMGSQLDLLVENQGRMSYDTEINEHKGITKNVTLGSFILKNWSHYLLFKNWSKELTTIDKHPDYLVPERVDDWWHRVPEFYASEFVLPKRVDLPLDTFLRLDGWGKGLAFINGFNLGRYWTVGPQLTLYTPKHLFNVYPRTNKLIVFELESVPNNRSVQFVSEMELNANTPYTHS